MNAEEIGKHVDGEDPGQANVGVSPAIPEALKRQDEPPDGGVVAWSQVLAGHLVTAVTWGLITSFGVFQTHYQENLPNSASAISWIGGVQVFLSFSIGTFSGRATDAGLARPLIFIGSLFLVIGTFMTSLATTYWQIFLAQGLCVGISFGIIWLPSITIISTYFSRNRSLAVTCAAAGSSSGGMIFPAMIQYLIPKIGICLHQVCGRYFDSDVAGFPWAVRCVAFLLLLCAIIFNAFLRTRLPPRKSGPLIEWSAFKEPAYVLFIIGVFFLYWSLLFAFFYVRGFSLLLVNITDWLKEILTPYQIQAFAHDVLGWSNTNSVNLVVIMNAAALFVRPVLGFIADRYLGPLNSLIPAVALCAVLLYCWIAVKTAAGLYAFAVIYGIASAAAMGLFTSTVPSLTKDLSKVGTRVGMVFTLMSLGPLTGQSLAGALIQYDHGNYLSAQLWGGSSMLLSTMALFSARMLATGWHLKAKL